MNCKYCGEKCIKKGKINKIQRYQCKNCGKTQQSCYIKPPIAEDKYEWVKRLNNEGCGISSIGRLLFIAKSSVQRVIERIAGKIRILDYHEENQSYEVDELRTYCGNKKNKSWVMYGINKHTGNITGIRIGKRTKENIKQITTTIMALNPKRVYTDGLNIYPSIIPKSKHRIFEYCTNKIERHNLILRTHLKRLSRKTLCYTKSDNMLENCMKLYCFG